MSSLIRKLLAGLSNAPEGPTIALVTDFGERDGYAGTMKGVLATINPQARVIDVSHEIAPQDVREAGYALWSAFRYFPAGTIFVAVVDPGVGSDRGIILLDTGDYIMIAPDNGTLDLVVADSPVRAVYGVNMSDPKAKWRRYALPSISATFHGRDIFAPIAGHLSLGVSPGQIGDPSEALAPQAGFCDAETGLGTPQVLHIDRFGNIITNVRAPKTPGAVRGVKFGRRRITRWIRFYDEAPGGTLSLIVGSSGLVEVILRQGSAARALRAQTDSPLEILS